jgi:glucose-6-phosphate 1-dehydrogenase
MVVPSDQVLVIFGASGDLTKRKLIPALYELNCQKLLPQKFIILGVGRTKLDDDHFRKKMIDELTENSKNTKIIPHELKDFINKLYYFPLDTKSISNYYLLKEKLDSIESEYKIPGNYLFYLATPPDLYEIIPEGLTKYGLNREDNNISRRIIIEKPFGYCT